MGRRHRHKKPRRLKHKPKRRKLSFTDITLIWLPITFIVFPFIEGQFGNYIHRSPIKYISYFIYFFSFICGVTYTYLLTKWIDKKMGYSDMSIWLRRLIAGVYFFFAIIFFLFTLAFGFAVVLSQQFFAQFKLTNLAILSLFYGVSIGLILFASYLMFSYMRRAGYIVFVR